jgi:hypothetical protein
MFVSVTTVETGDRPIEDATLVGEEMQGWLKDVEGFEGILLLSKDGTTLGLTFWQSEEAAERARPLRMQFLERMLSVAEVEIQSVEGYEIAFAGLGPNLVGAPR